MDVNELINEKLIFLDFDAKNKLEVLNELGKLISKSGKLYDEKYGKTESLEGFIKSVQEREKIFATAVGFSFAIPHGKSEYVRQSSIAYARLTEEIEWSEEEKVHHIFMIGVPEEKAGDEHLEILIKLSTAILEDDFRERLEKAKSNMEVMELIKEYSERERNI